jgi:hypothetical protein
MATGAALNGKPAKKCGKNPGIAKVQLFLLRACSTSLMKRKEMSDW